MSQAGTACPNCQGFCGILRLEPHGPEPSHLRCQSHCLSERSSPIFSQAFTYLIITSWTSHPLFVFLYLFCAISVSVPHQWGLILANEEARPARQVLRLLLENRRRLRCKGVQTSLNLDNGPTTSNYIFILYPTGLLKHACQTPLLHLFQGHGPAQALQWPCLLYSRKQRIALRSSELWFKDLTDHILGTNTRGS